MRVEETCPYEPTRESARDQLREIFESSDWYSARYEAGTKLANHSSELSRSLKSWVCDLEAELGTRPLKAREDLRYLYSRLDSTENVLFAEPGIRAVLFGTEEGIRKISSLGGGLEDIRARAKPGKQLIDALRKAPRYYRSAQGKLQYYSPQGELWNIYTGHAHSSVRCEAGLALVPLATSESELKRLYESEFDKVREAAAGGLVGLTSDSRLLRDIYRKSTYPHNRREAGKSLGYSGFRIFFREHRDSLLGACFWGISIAALATIVYLSIKYDTEITRMFQKIFNEDLPRWSEKIFNE